MVWQRTTSCRARFPARGTTAVELTAACAVVLGVVVLGGAYLADRMQVAFMRAAEFHPQAGRPAQSATVARNQLATAGGATFSNRLWNDPTFLSLASILGLGFVAETVALARRRRKIAAEEVPNDTDHSQLPTRLFEKRQNLLRRLAAAAAAGNLHGLRILDVMTGPVATLSPFTSVAEVATLMNNLRMRHVLICGDDDRLLGIISDRDLSQRRGRTARDIMSRRIVSVSGNTELIPAVTSMMNRGISALPILEDGRAVGILTTTDALLVLQCMLLLKHRDEAPVGETV